VNHGAAAIAPGGGLCDLAATELAQRLRAREVSAREVVQAHLERVEAVNPSVNAIVTLTSSRALELAAAADEALAAGSDVGPLHGLPVAHKDLQDTAGVRTTYGSTLFADHVPSADSIVVERMRSAGAISLGKTNTPEFGAGSQTYNAVFGATRNPWDLAKTPGGSSGGAAAALVTGMVALADGSDMGGSLRNPASFCGVVGLRPSLGRVPSWPADNAYFGLGVDGPMGRTVGDVALLLSALAGPDPRDPQSLPAEDGSFAAPTPRLHGVRVGWSADLGGLPIDPRVTAVLERGGLQALTDGGAEVGPLALDMNGAEEAFRTLRAWQFAASLGPLVDEHRGEMNPDLVANVDAGRSLTGADVARAMAERTLLWHRVVATFDEVDVIAAPVSAVPPFDAGTPWVREVAGVPQEDYLGWMRSAYWVSATGLPAMSVPCGFTDEGLPVGLQLVGRPLGERALLEIAAGFEEASSTARRLPPIGS
jgi:amidase